MKTRASVVAARGGCNLPLPSTPYISSPSSLQTTRHQYDNVVTSSPRHTANLTTVPRSSLYHGTSLIDNTTRLLLIDFHNNI